MDEKYNNYTELMKIRLNNILAEADAQRIIDLGYDAIASETNNLSTSTETLTQQFTSLKSACENNGIQLILNHIPMLNGKTSDCIRVNGIIDSLNLDGAKFDIATAVDNNPSNGCNTSLFVDGTHPNVSGSQKMYERMKIDLPYLFDI